MSIEDSIGWLASALLICTLAHQIHTQFKAPNAKAVSHWLFIGQSLSSIGFIVYSALLGNWVFIVTNALILLTAVVGQIVLVLRERRGR
jgi:MtN3 and saliva related transmembrane protein